jgi:hypothetical protein
MPDPKTSDRLEILVAPAYAVAALLVLTPTGDFMSGVWPWRPGALDWRFASSGLLSGFLLTPLLGVLIAVTVAAARGHDRVLRTLGLMTLIAATIWLLILAAFILDAVQLHASIPEAQRRSFLDASIKAFIKYVLSCSVAFLLGIRAWRMGRRRSAQSAVAPRGTIVLGAEEMTS